MARIGLPGVVGLIMIAALTGFILAATWQMTDGGQNLYGLDDAYIHLGHARSLVEAGVWGVTRHEFSGSSSSILWPIVLAVPMFVVGVQPWVGLAMNLLFAAVAVLVATWVAGRLAPKRLGVSVSVAVLVFAGPLVTLAFSGMEHNLQIALFLALVATVCWVGEDGGGEWRWPGALALLLTATRYESLIVVGLLTIVALARSHRQQALALAGGAALPVLAYGLFSKMNGGLFFPNSVLIKSPFLDAHSLTDKLSVIGQNLVPDRYNVPLLTAMGLLIVALALARRAEAGAFPKGTVAALGVLLIAAFGHLCLGRTGWFFRYEAYLVAGAIVFALPVIFATPWPRVRVAALPALIGGGLLIWRGVDALSVTPQSVRNIYDQQVQMARFVKTNYNDSQIVLNDIGAVSFFTDARIIDLAGLATQEVADRIVNHYYFVGYRKNLTTRKRPAVLAMVYPEWFLGLPDNWTRVATLTISDNFICAYPSVVIFTLPAGDEAKLRQHLQAWPATMPWRNRLDILP